MLELHDGEKRKGSGRPFASHPLNVLFILQDVTKDEAILVGGLLHDVFKETKEAKKYSHRKLAQEFGPSIASIVRDVSEYHCPKGQEKITWKERKYQALQKFPQMKLSGQMIFVADKIDNLMSLVDDYVNFDQKIWEKFNASEEDIAKYYQDISVSLTTHFQHPLMRRYYEAYMKAVDLFGWPVDSWSEYFRPIKEKEEVLSA